MARFSLHAVGKDRPGIIAGVAGALAELGANLEDSRMTILRGQFAIMLVLDAPGIADGGLIEGALEPVADELNLFFAVRPMPGWDYSPANAPRYAISVDGADRPGIVAGITGVLAGLGVNVVELSSRLVEGDAAGYVLRLSVVLPDGLSVEQLERALVDEATTLGVSCAVAPQPA